MHKPIGLLLILAITPKLSAKLDLNWKKTSPLQLRIKEIVNPKSGEINTHLKFRRKSATGSYGKWVLAGQDSWDKFTEKQKCNLHNFLKEEKSEWAKEINCKQFIKLFKKQIEQNNYITVDNLFLKNNINFILNLASSKVKMDGRGIVGKACGNNNEPPFTILSNNFIDTLSIRLPLNRHTGINYPSSSYCKFKNHKEGPFDSFRLNTYKNNNANKITPSFFFNYIFENVYAGFSEIDTDMINKKRPLRKNNETSVNSFINNTANDFNEVIASTKEINDICEGQKCKSEAFNDLNAKIEDCEKTTQDKYEEKQQQLAEINSDTPKNLKLEQSKLDLAYQESVEQSNQLKKAIKATQNGNSRHLDEIVSSKEIEIIKANQEKQKRALDESRGLGKQQLLIQEKENKGISLSNEEQSIKEKEIEHTTTFIDSKTGNVLDTITYSVDDFYKVDNAIIAGSSEDNFSNAVIDFSQTKNGSFERVEKISSRIMLEGQRRSYNISSEQANKMASDYIADEKPIINFDNLFNTNAAAPVGKTEENFLAKSLSANKNESRATAIKMALKKEDPESEDYSKLKMALVKTNQEKEEKNKEIEKLIAVNSALAREFPLPNNQGNQVVAQQLSNANSNQNHNTSSPLKYNTPSRSGSYPASQSSSFIRPVTTNNYGDPPHTKTNSDNLQDFNINRKSSPKGGSITNHHPNSNDKDDARNHTASEKSKIAESGIHKDTIGTEPLSSNNNTAHNINSTSELTPSPSENNVKNRTAASRNGDKENTIPSRKIGFGKYKEFVAAMEKARRAPANEALSYNDMMKKFVRSGIKDLGKKTISRLFEKYLSHKTKDSAIIIKENIFNEPPKTIISIISIAIHLNGNKDYFFVESTDESQLEMMEYDNTKGFTPKGEGPMMKRLELAGKLQLLGDLNYYATST